MRDATALKESMFSDVVSSSARSMDRSPELDDGGDGLLGASAMAPMTFIVAPSNRGTSGLDGVWPLDSLGEVAGADAPQSPHSDYWAFIDLGSLVISGSKTLGSIQWPRALERELLFTVMSGDEQKVISKRHWSEGQHHETVTVEGVGRIRAHIDASLNDDRSVHLSERARRAAHRFGRGCVATEAPLPAVAIGSDGAIVFEWEFKHNVSMYVRVFDDLVKIHAFDTDTDFVDVALDVDSASCIVTVMLRKFSDS